MDETGQSLGRWWDHLTVEEQRHLVAAITDGNLDLQGVLLLQRAEIGPALLRGFGPFWNTSARRRMANFLRWRREEAREFTDADRASFRAPPCEVCGGGPVEVDWVDNSDASSSIRRWSLGTHHCFSRDHPQD